MYCIGLNAKLENDANACAIAEWRFGAGKGTQNMIFKTFGTGLGAGLISDGKLYSLKSLLPIDFFDFYNRQLKKYLKGENL